MTRPEISEIREMERSDNFHFKGDYWCVIRYLLITNSESYYGNLHLVTLSKSEYIGDHYWKPTKQRTYTRKDSAKKYYKKVRHILMTEELKEEQ